MFDRRLTSAVLLGAALSFFAQPGSAQNVSPEVQQGLTNWRNLHGSNWHIVYNEVTDQARMLFGGAADPEFTPTTPVQARLIARYFIDDAYDMLGVDADPNVLSFDRWILLPLGMIGSSDKATFRFRQLRNGVPILNGWVNVLMEYPSGRLLSIDSSYCPTATSVNPVPSVSIGTAQTVAQVTFEAEFGAVDFVHAPELVVVPNEAPGELAQLRWRVDVEGYDQAGDPADRAYYIAAHGEPQIAGHDVLVDHAAPQTSGAPKGIVEARVTEGSPAWLPDDGTNRETVRLPHMTVVANTGEVTETDSNGEFQLSPPTSGPLTATLELKGPFVEVLNDPGLGGPTIHVQGTVAGLSTTFRMNPAPATMEEVSQTNAFHRMNQTRDWVRAINPFDDTLDSRSPVAQLPYRAYVNSSLGGVMSPGNPGPHPTCAGVFRAKKNRIELSAAGDPLVGAPCPSASFGPILWHEFGHWLNRRYGMVVGSSAFNEAIADVWAMYQMDDPVLSYYGTTRSGLNNRQYCGHCKNQQACHPGGIHGNGLPLMGAMWKTRANLKWIDPATGGLIADSLFLGWMNAYNVDLINMIILYQWLVLDDDDGNLLNGTPNFGSITAGFNSNGFGPYQLPPAAVICKKPSGGGTIPP